MHKAYKAAIVYFLLFSVLLLLSSVLLFEEKIGFIPEAVLNYYLGDEQRYTPPKSYSGTLKIILEHIFAFGLFAMVLLHFVVFTKKELLKLSALLFVATLLELFSPFLILSGYEIFAYFKLLGFFIFEFFILYILWILFTSIVEVKH